VSDQPEHSPDVVWHRSRVGRADRPRSGFTVWITGLSGSGKSTLACAIEWQLVSKGWYAYLLDGDNLRHGLSADLGFSDACRRENVRRVGHVAQLFADSGAAAVVALISPERASRERVRAEHVAAGIPFVEVFLDVPMSECEKRDPKGLYARSRSGRIASFTGVDSQYEPPTSADIVLRASDGDPETMAKKVIDHLLNSVSH
jgi:bifunctional enzyme CysN/CysC